MASVMEVSAPCQTALYELEALECNFWPDFPLRTLYEHCRAMSTQETARCFYTAMRAEINQHLNIVNQVYTLYLAGASALFAGSMNKDGNQNLLLLIPFLSLGAANMLASHERAIGSIAAYCARELDKFLSNEMDSVVQWDKSLSIGRFKNSHYASNRAGGLTLVVIPGLAALFLNGFKTLRAASWTLPLNKIETTIKLTAWFLCAACLYRAASLIIETACYRKELGARFTKM